MANPKRRLLDNAGRMSDEAYADVINQIAQNNYLRWGIPLEEAKREIASDNTYDYRGYYSKYPDSQANANTHWSDEFKGATHPTFSNESVYHGKVDKRFNPYGLRGGMWFGDVYQPHAGFRRKLFAGGGLINLIPVSLPSNTHNKKVKNVLSYAPITGSATDIETAIKNPTVGNVANAAITVGSDILGGWLLRDINKARKAYKTAKATEQAAEEALTAHRKATRNVIARSVSEEDRRLSRALQTAREQRALKEGYSFLTDVLQYPVWGAWAAGDATVNTLQNH